MKKGLFLTIIFSLERKKMKIYNDDCLTILKTIPSNSIDLVLTDPPYGTTKNKWDKMLNWEEIWKELNRICKDNAAIILFGQDPFTSFLINSNLKGYKHKWIWNKKSSANFAVARYMPLTVTEDILIFSKDGKKVNYFPQMVTGKNRMRGSKNAKSNGEGFGGIKQVYYASDQYYPTNLLSYSVVPRKQSLHPSQKPVELLQYLIKTYSKENDTVVDLCMGVGSSIEAAMLLNRIPIGIELDKKYYDIACERLQKVEAIMENTRKRIEEMNENYKKIKERLENE